MPKLENKSLKEQAIVKFFMLYKREINEHW